MRPPSSSSGVEISIRPISSLETHTVDHSAVHGVSSLMSAGCVIETARLDDNDARRSTFQSFMISAGSSDDSAQKRPDLISSPICFARALTSPALPAAIARDSKVKPECLVR